MDRVATALGAVEVRRRSNNPDKQRFPVRREKRDGKRANTGGRKRWATGAANGKWRGEDWTGEARRKSERGITSWQRVK